MTFNESLYRSLDHIEGYYVSALVLQLGENGIFELLVDGATAESIAKEKSMNEEVLEGVFEFLDVEGIVSINSGFVSLTELGKDLFKQRGWYQLLIGGYAPTFSGLGNILSEGKSAAARNELMVAVGSGNIDHFDVIPTAKQVIKNLSLQTRRIVDIGCGTADCLIELCKEFDVIECIGVSGGEEVSRIANSLVHEAELENRITIRSQDAFSYRTEISPDLILAAFVLQEIAYQRGMAGLISFLKRIKHENPNSMMMVFEVPKVAPSNPGLRSKSGSYYRSYFLIHALTKQKLLSIEEWEDVFEKSGYTIRKTEPVSPDYDNSELEVCFVLEPIR